MVLHFSAAASAALAVSASAVPAQTNALSVGGDFATRCSPIFIKHILSTDSQTEVIATRFFAKGEQLPLKSKAKLAARANLCMVKLRVGPGTPGPSDAPSTQRGIGLEIWLPSQNSWNGRIHNLGGGGYAGTPEVTDPNFIVEEIVEGNAPSYIAAVEGAVSGFTDTGHSRQSAGLDGSFLMLPDGSPNQVQWNDFSERGIHELAIKSKLIAHGFYGRSARYSYFEGCSTGGRQAHKLAQNFPEDYDGIIGGAPAINWTRFISSEIYPQLVMQRDIGRPISPEKLERASAAAVSACDTVAGRHTGYITDPKSCRYDPSKDKKLLCKAQGGSDTSKLCLSRAEAKAVTKMWYGQTVDGSAPSPASSTGFSSQLGAGQLWFGLPRGTQLLLGMSREGVAMPFPISTHLLALISDKAAMADATFKNASSNGEDGWKNLSYQDLASISKRGVERQTLFSNIDSDNSNLAKFRDRGAKFIAYHGLADPLIAPQGTMNYYDALSKNSGGTAATANFYRFFTVPAMGHCSGVGSVNGIAGVSPVANPPLPEQALFYQALTNWVEQGKAPDDLKISNNAGEQHPLCQYPKSLSYSKNDYSGKYSYICK